MITASIYNEAGELVARLGSIPSANHMGLVELLDMSTGAAIGVIASTQTLDVSVPGIMTPSGIGGNFSWNCVNDGGQKVSDGSYYIHVEERDLYGHTNSVTQPLTVIQVVEYTKITVFNSAGEVVREILIDKTPAPDIKLSVSDKLVLDKNKNYPIVIGYSSQGDTVNWDGQNDYGTMVSSGSYEIRIETKDLKGIVTMASKTVIILREDSGNLMEDISAYPNPLAKSSQSVMKIKWCNGGNLGEMRIRIINCAGELVKNINVRLESKIASWDLNTAGGKPAAPGIYVILLDAKSDSGYIKQNILKVSVIKGY
jgi:flagellar hook assembly protein FlgD